MTGVSVRILLSARRVRKVGEERCLDPSIQRRGRRKCSNKGPTLVIFINNIIFISYESLSNSFDEMKIHYWYRYSRKPALIDMDFHGGWSTKTTDITTSGIGIRNLRTAHAWWLVFQALGPSFDAITGISVAHLLRYSEVNFDSRTTGLLCTSQAVYLLPRLNSRAVYPQLA